MTFKIIDDKDKRNKIRQAIKDNDGYCICATIKTEGTKCNPCRSFLEQETLGKCHCGLYEKTEL